MSLEAFKVRAVSHPIVIFNDLFFSTSYPFTIFLYFHALTWYLWIEVADELITGTFMSDTVSKLVI